MMTWNSIFCIQWHVISFQPLMNLVSPLEYNQIYANRRIATNNIPPGQFLTNENPPPYQKYQEKQTKLTSNPQIIHSSNTNSQVQQQTSAPILMVDNVVSGSLELVRFITCLYYF